MIPAAFEYHAPRSIGEATALLVALGADAKILSGGQSLIPLMKLRLASPRPLVDINGIPGLDHVREADGHLRIGALTRESDLEESDVIRARYPLLHDTCAVIADPLVRNLAAVGGNLAHGDSANDHPATMLALAAEVVATGPRGLVLHRTVRDGAAARRDPRGDPDPRSAPAQRRGLSEARAQGGRLRDGRGGRAARARRRRDVRAGRIGLTNVGLTPITATAAEAALRGQRPDEAASRRAAELAAAASSPAEDLRGSVESKRDLVRVLTARALRGVGRCGSSWRSTERSTRPTSSRASCSCICCATCCG
jgi:carbon-monoxide dehydrogenase medium subunit